MRPGRALQRRWPRRRNAKGWRPLEAAGIDVASAEEDTQRRADTSQLRNTASGEWSGGSSWQSLARGHRLH